MLLIPGLSCAVAKLLYHALGGLHNGHMATTKGQRQGEPPRSATHVEHPRISGNLAGKPVDQRVVGAAWVGPKRRCVGAPEVVVLRRLFLHPQGLSVVGFHALFPGLSSGGHFELPWVGGEVANGTIMATASACAKRPCVPVVGLGGGLGLRREGLDCAGGPL